MDVLSNILKHGLHVTWLVNADEDEINGVRVSPELKGRGIEVEVPTHEDSKSARRIALEACVKDCLRKNNLEAK